MQNQKLEHNTNSINNNELNYNTHKQTKIDKDFSCSLDHS